MLLHCLLRAVMPCMHVLHVHMCNGMVRCKGILGHLASVLTILTPSRHHAMEITIPAAVRRKSSALCAAVVQLQGDARYAMTDARHQMMVPICHRGTLIFVYIHLTGSEHLDSRAVTVRSEAWQARPHRYQGSQRQSAPAYRHLMHRLFVS